MTVMQYLQSMAHFCRGNDASSKALLLRATALLPYGSRLNQRNHTRGRKFHICYN